MKLNKNFFAVLLTIISLTTFASAGFSEEIAIPEQNDTVTSDKQPQTKSPNIDNAEITPTLNEENSTNNNNPNETKTLSGRAIIVDLSSDKLEYDQENQTFTAEGSAKVLITDQQAELSADKIIYNEKEQFLTAEGHVKIIKKDKTILGNFAKIDLKKESALISDPNTVVSKVRMNAQEAHIFPDFIELKNGNAVISQDNIDIQISSGEYKPQELKPDIPGHETVIPDNKDLKKAHYKIIAKEIELDRAKSTNNLVIKNAKVYIGKLKVASLPIVRLSVDEKINTVETMLPEVGFNKSIGGFYMGPSLTLDLPKNSVLRLSPVFSAFGSENAVGGGGIARFRSSINKTDIAYTSTGGRLVVNGEQKLYKNTTKILYKVNDYLEDDFIGIAHYKPRYFVELVDERKLGQVLNHNIFSRGGFGIGENFGGGVTTGRLQLQGSIISNKPLISLKNYVELRLQSQFNLSGYGTGDKYAVVRGGPRVNWNLGRLSLTTTYLQAGIWGSTPFKFDEFIRGTSNLILAGDFRINKYLSVGNIRSLNLLKDGALPQLTTENQVYARIGPEDFKFRIGYDIERKVSTFGLDLFLGSGRSALSFEKMKILHPDQDNK